MNIVWKSREELAEMYPDDEVREEEDESSIWLPPEEIAKLQDEYNRTRSQAMYDRRTPLKKIEGESSIGMDMAQVARSGLYDRRKGDTPGEDNLPPIEPPHDYEEPHHEWVLLDRYGHAVNQEGNAFGNWLARMLHGYISVYCEIRDGEPVFPGRLRR